MGAAKHVVHPGYGEGVLPRMANGDHGRGEGFNAVGHSLQLALQLVVRGHRVIGRGTHACSNYSTARMAAAPYAAAGPPPIPMATPMASAISCRVAPAFKASWTWNAMHGSHRMTTAMATEISSLCFVERAPSAAEALWSSPKAFITSGMHWAILGVVA